VDKAMGELVMAGFKKLGFIQFAGIDNVDFGNGRNAVAMTPKPEHLNHNGDIHAAMLFGLAETAAMGASVSGIVDHLTDSFIVTSGGHIEYLARARGTAGPFTATSEIPADVYAAARAEVAAKSPTEFQVPFVITDNDGRAVSRGAFTAIVRPRRNH
jgi:acyl-coenzyme A thioesterase PaaI-like protein